MNIVRPPSFSNYRVLFNELDHWIYIGIGEDIFIRDEYKPYIIIAEKLKIQRENIPSFILGMLLIKAEQKENTILARIKRFFKKVKLK